MWFFMLLYAMVFPACLIYMLPLERSANFWLRFNASAAALLLIGGMLVWAVFNKSGNQMLWNFFWAVRPLLALGVCLLTIRVSLGSQGAEEVAYCAVWAYLTREFCFDFSQIISSFLVPGVGAYDRRTFFISLLCHGLVFLGAYFLIARNLPTKQHYGGSAELLRAPLLLTALVTAVKPVALLVDKQGVEYNVFIFVQVICTFFVMAALYAQQMEGKRLTLEQELETQRLLWRQHERQLEEARQNTELLNYKYHDLKHYIAAARSEMGGGKGIGALEELERSVKVFDRAIQTGNDVLDTVLTEKKLLCERRSITMTCVADGALLRRMDTVDLYAIFGNAVDNAVECVSALPDPEQRVIAIAVFQVQHMVKIQVENFYTGSLSFEDGLPMTSKGDKAYHGYGLKSIRHMAEKYEGCMAVEARDGLFILHILLPAGRISEAGDADYEEKATS